MGAHVADREPGQAVLGPRVAAKQGTEPFGERGAGIGDPVRDAAYQGRHSHAPQHAADEVPERDRLPVGNKPRPTPELRLGLQAAVGKDQRVEEGDLLAKVDLDAVKAAGYDTTTMVVVINTATLKSVTPVGPGDVSLGDPVIDIEA